MDPGARTRSSRRRGILLALTTALLWGTIPIAGKFALTGVTPVFLSFVRFTVAGVLMLGAMWWFRREKLAVLRDPPKLALLAAVGLTGNYLLYFMGLARTTATAAQLVIQLSSVFLFMWGVLLFRERASPARVLGATAAIAGVVLVNWNGLQLEVLLESEYLLGNLLVAGAALSWSFYAVSQKRMNEDASSYEILLLVLLGSALLTSVPAVPDAPARLGWVPFAAVAYLSVNTFVAYGSFAESLRHVDASVVSVMTTFAPVVTILLALPLSTMVPSVFGDESFSVYTLTGAVLIIGGIVLVVREHRNAPD